MDDIRDDDIRLVYIGSAHKAIHYAFDHLPEPTPRADQILAVQSVTDLHDERGGPLCLPPWCHIATELHTTRDPARTFEALGEAVGPIFMAAVACRRKLPKAGV